MQNQGNSPQKIGLAYTCSYDSLVYLIEPMGTIGKKHTASFVF